MTLPYMHHRRMATPPPPPSGAFVEYHRHLPKTSNLLESDATRALKAMTALNDMGRVPNASVVKLCHDDRFMNLLCGILNTTDTLSNAPCSLTPHSTTTGATTITTARSEQQQQDNVYDAMIDSLINSYDAPILGEEYTIGATMIATRSELANEVVETPLVGSTTVRTVSPDNNLVGSSATHTTKKRKADEDEPPAHHNAPSLYLDGDSFAKFDKHCPILHLGVPPLGARLVAKKTRTTTVAVDTSSSLAALDTKTVTHVDVPTSSPFKNDPVDESFVLKTLHDPVLDDGRINPVHMIVREHVLNVRRSMSGKVFFQCKYCAHLPVQERAHQSTVSPQSINKLYRANVRFHMSHVRNCEYIPEWIKSCSPKKSRIGNSGGVKTSWEDSAMAMGLHDDVERKCIVYS